MVHTLCGIERGLDRAAGGDAGSAYGSTRVSNGDVSSRGIGSICIARLTGLAFKTEHCLVCDSRRLG